ncbi:alpha-L-rhamnosidase, partial [candidate division KSB1 bacterium]|nr:alpha-L-rhamnosidase [candidate division KSB1 bacterium]
MKNIILLALLLLFTFLSASPESINPDLLTKRWPAYWIAHPTAPLCEYGVYHFRKVFSLEAQPETFIVHVSADNRYHLNINGRSVCYGPARGDRYHWRFESVDIAGYLQAGENVVAAVVWNFAEYAPVAQKSVQTGFILQGDGPPERIVDTDTSWKVIKNTAYQPLVNHGALLHQYIVVGPGDKVDGLQYPWGWQSIKFDDSEWPSARQLTNGQPSGTGTDLQWILQPRTIPLMESHIQTFSAVREAEGIKVPEGFLAGFSEFKIPPLTNIRILLDQGFLTTAYPQLVVSDGTGASMKMTFCEALFDQNGEKGHRDVVDGKKIVGYYDMFLPDGGQHRLFRPLWFRTFRYVELEIKTAEQALHIHSLNSEFTGYPFVQNAIFESGDPSLKQIWDVGWRTARLCAGETYYDCPYYEQLQYVGDTRIQALISLYASGDDRLMRKAIQMFEDSRAAFGLTESRYPSSRPQYIPPYSLFWIAMVHDYWQHRDDEKFIASMLNGVWSVLDWFNGYVDETGMLGPMPWWHFVDWPDQWAWSEERRIGGVPPGAGDGHSSNITLQYIYALNYAAGLFNAFGRHSDADECVRRAEHLRKATLDACWEKSRGLVADTPEKKHFSQHANIFAVLTDMVPPEQQRTLIEKVLSDKDLVQCTFYFRFYLTRALNKVGLGGRYIEMLQPWRDMLDIGLTTFAERPEPTRSDCHAWSASPNYEFFATVCGVTPASAGFKTVRIEPRLGPLLWVKGEMPHPQGRIKVALERVRKDGLKGIVELPDGIEGVIIWNGKEKEINAGVNEIR